MTNAARKRECIPGPELVTFAVVDDQVPREHDEDLVLTVMRVPGTPPAGIDFAFEDGRDRVSKNDT